MGGGGGGGGNKNDNKNSVRGSTEGAGGSRLGDRIRFLKQIVQKYTQVTIPNLLNGLLATVVFIGKWFNVHLH